jgi:hypothetical protein
MIKVKIYNLSNRIRLIESDIIDYRMDMMIINDLYYCGRGDVEEFTDRFCSDSYRKILACNRLIQRLRLRLDVVGA